MLSYRCIQLGRMSSACTGAFGADHVKNQRDSGCQDWTYWYGLLGTKINESIMEEQGA